MRKKNRLALQLLDNAWAPWVNTGDKHQKPMIKGTISAESYLKFADIVRAASVSEFSEEQKSLMLAQIDGVDIEGVFYRLDALSGADLAALDPETPEKNLKTLQGTISLIVNVAPNAKAKNACLGALRCEETGEELAAIRNTVLEVFQNNEFAKIYKGNDKDVFIQHNSAICGFFQDKVRTSDQRKFMLRTILGACVNDSAGLMRGINFLDLVLTRRLNDAGELESLHDVDLTSSLDHYKKLLKKDSIEHAFFSLIRKFQTEVSFDLGPELKAMHQDLLTSRALVGGIPDLARRSSEAEAAKAYLSELNRRKEGDVPTDKELVILCGPDVVKSLLWATVESPKFKTEFIHALRQNTLVSTAISRHAFKSVHAAKFWTSFFQKHPEAAGNSEFLSWMPELIKHYGVAAPGMETFWDDNRPVFIQQAGLTLVASDTASEEGANDPMAKIFAHFQRCANAMGILRAAERLISAKSVFGRHSLRFKGAMVRALFKRLSSASGEEVSAQQRWATERKQLESVKRAETRLLAEHFAETNAQTVAAWLPSLDKILGDGSAIIDLTKDSGKSVSDPKLSFLSRTALIAYTIRAHLGRKENAPHLVEALKNGDLTRIWDRECDKSMTFGQLLTESESFKANLQRVLKAHPELLDSLVAVARTFFVNSATASHEEALTAPPEQALLEAAATDVAVQFDIKGAIQTGNAKSFSNPIRRAALLTRTAENLLKELGYALVIPERAYAGLTLPEAAEPKLETLARAYNRVLKSPLKAVQKSAVIREVLTLMKEQPAFATAVLSQSRVMKLLFAGRDGLVRFNQFFYAAPEKVEVTAAIKFCHIGNEDFEKKLFEITIFPGSIIHRWAKAYPTARAELVQKLGASDGLNTTQDVAAKESERGTYKEVTKTEFEADSHKRLLQRFRDRYEVAAQSIENRVSHFFSGLGQMLLRYVPILGALSRWSANLENKTKAAAVRVTGKNLERAKAKQERKKKREEAAKEEAAKEAVKQAIAPTDPSAQPRAGMPTTDAAAGAAVLLTSLLAEPAATATDPAGSIGCDSLPQGTQDDFIQELTQKLASQPVSEAAPGTGGFTLLYHPETVAFQAAVPKAEPEADSKLDEADTSSEESSRPASPAGPDGTRLLAEDDTLPTDHSEHGNVTNYLAEDSTMDASSRLPELDTPNESKVKAGQQDILVEEDISGNLDAASTPGEKKDEEGDTANLVSNLNPVDESVQEAPQGGSNQPAGMFGAAGGNAAAKLGQQKELGSGEEEREATHSLNQPGFASEKPEA